jgi:hypothetical protein
LPGRPRGRSGHRGAGVGPGAVAPDAGCDIPFGSGGRRGRRRLAQSVAGRAVVSKSSHGARGFTGFVNAISSMRSPFIDAVHATLGLRGAHYPWPSGLRAVRVQQARVGLAWPFWARASSLPSGLVRRSRGCRLVERGQRSGGVGQGVFEAALGQRPGEALGSVRFGTSWRRRGGLMPGQPVGAGLARMWSMKRSVRSVRDHAASARRAHAGRNRPGSAWHARGP